MDVERARTYLLKLPHVAETLQWGNNLVFWVGNKATGGKMFALIDLDGAGGPVIAFAAGPEHAAELCERQGFRPAPYLARAHWVAAERWDVMGVREWERELAAAHAVVWAKLPARVRSVLDGTRKENGKVAVRSV
jgi:predicted DNA-binding protein (MmcQ/YjbR family)